MLFSVSLLLSALSVGLSFLGEVSPGGGFVPGMVVVSTDGLGCFGEREVIVCLLSVLCALLAAGVVTVSRS